MLGYPTCFITEQKDKYFVGSTGFLSFKKTSGNIHVSNFYSLDQKKVAESIETVTEYESNKWRGPSSHLTAGIERVFVRQQVPVPYKYRNIEEISAAGNHVTGNKYQSAARLMHYSPSRLKFKPLLLMEQPSVLGLFLLFAFYGA